MFFNTARLDAPGDSNSIGMHYDEVFELKLNTAACFLVLNCGSEISMSLNDFSKTVLLLAVATNGLDVIFQTETITQGLIFTGLCLIFFAEIN